MNILILGSGGREHALAWKMAASPLADKLYCAPGNAGIAREAQCVALDLADHKAVIAFCQANKIDFVVVGPEVPLVAGIVDDLEAAGIKTFGPSKWAARLEGSKGFTKDLCKANKIPTAAYERFKGAAAAKDYVRKKGAPIVVKADGLAAGKGVVVAETVAEAEAAIDMMFDGGLGQPAWEIVIEDCMVGEEASFFALCDGESAITLASAQDHKRVGDGDKGPNTGGMGAYSPAPIMTPAMNTARDGRDHHADRARHEGDGRALQRRAVRRVDDHQRRSATDRIQRALRRSRDASDDASSDVGSGAGSDRRARRAIEEFRSALAAGRGPHGRDGGERLSRAL